VNTCSAPYHMKTDKRTYADRAEYLKKAVAQRRKKLMQQAIEYKGGNCMICGYNKCIRALTFHHVDPSQKSFGISARGITRSWEKIKDELDKCVLLCANCHAEVHDGITQLSVERPIEE
jgi:5-methylcytosine-specific restriction endonuclease McrA